MYYKLLKCTQERQFERDTLLVSHISLRLRCITLHICMYRYLQMCTYGSELSHIAAKEPAKMITTES